MASRPLRAGDFQLIITKVVRTCVQHNDNYYKRTDVADCSMWTSAATVKSHYIACQIFAAGDPVAPAETRQWIEARAADYAVHSTLAYLI